MKVHLAAAALALLGGVLPLGAQTEDDAASPTPTPVRDRRQAELRRAFWKAELPGGQYLVALGAIQAVATQQYVLDGAARVVEVNVVTTGPFQPRFYYVEPFAAAAMAPAVPGAQTAISRAESTAQNLAARVVPGDPLWAKVVKNYPTTTHAGTLEFRLESREQLDQLFESVERAWTSGVSEVFTPAGPQSYQPPAPRRGGESSPSPTPTEDEP